ncbi:MAG: family transcriptional regulator, partial [Mycobacterium sp.]|nr:family transcriptional regulator [Mycobacterium sp.]
EAMEFPADTGLTLTAYSAQSGTPSHDGLNLLASWAATTDQTHNADTGQTPNHTPEPAGPPNALRRAYSTPISCEAVRPPLEK